MKKIFLLFLFTVSCVFIYAQERAVKSPKEEIAVAAVVEKLRAAMISGNRAELNSLVTADLTYGHSNGRMQDKAAFVDALTTKKSDFKTIELTGQQITIQGEAAIVQHTLIADTNDGGVPGHTRLGIVLVLKKEKGTWKVMARRAFKVAD